MTDMTELQLRINRLSTAVWAMAGVLGACMLLIAALVGYNLYRTNDSRALLMEVAREVVNARIDREFPTPSKWEMEQREKEIEQLNKS